MKLKRLKFSQLLAFTILVIFVAAVIYVLIPSKFEGNAVSTISMKKIPKSDTISGDLKTSHVKYFNGTDKTRLAYRSYTPANPKAIVIFYHGSGANSGAGYIPIGETLSKEYNIATYLPDIRGHGLSGGDRGDTPTIQQVYDDITSLIKLAKSQYPSVPIFLGGHSAGAGLVINYANSPKHESTNGYLLVSPDFGLKSNTVKDGPNSFVSVLKKPFIVNAITHGLLMGHTYALRFNYPESSLKSGAGLIQYNTVNMALALNPSNPDKEVSALDHSFGLWIGANDEVLDSSKVIAYAKCATKVISTSHLEIVPNETHLSILNNVANKIGPWVLDNSK